VGSKRVNISGLEKICQFGSFDWQKSDTCLVFFGAGDIDFLVANIEIPNDKMGSGLVLGCIIHQMIIKREFIAQHFGPICSWTTIGKVAIDDHQPIQVDLCQSSIVVEHWLIKGVFALGWFFFGHNDGAGIARFGPCMPCDMIPQVTNLVWHLIGKCFGFLEADDVRIKGQYRLDKSFFGDTSDTIDISGKDFHENKEKDKKTYSLGRAKT